MTSAHTFPLLFSPFALGTMRLKNRLVMPPMMSLYGDPDGSVTQQLLDYYEERAKGGVGLIIVEFTCIDRGTGRIHAQQLGIDEDRCIPGLRQLVQVIQQYGAKAAIQIGHGGIATSSELLGRKIIGPSAIARPGGEVACEMTQGEIRQLVLRFAEGAVRAKKAGFDGVEIHAAHRFLVQQFLSAAWNRRHDEYGGDMVGRTRFLIEVIRAIREKVGRDFPLWCRINGREEEVDGGTSIEEAVMTARMAEEAGVDAIDVSWASVATRFHPMSLAPAYSLPLAETVKKAVRVPVMTVGKIYARLGERILQEGKADLICIGRGLIAGPGLPQKTAEGRGDEVLPCIACDNCRDHVVYKGERLRCSVNAAVGRERELALRPAASPRRVVVIGGGPAGMEAARIAALRGHQVTLYEKNPRLGGQLLQAAVPPHKVGIPVLTRFLSGQLQKLGVEVKLGREASTNRVLEEKPEAVIVATGARSYVPDIPGLEKAFVVTAEQVLLGEPELGGRVVVIGGELVGCETAEVLADRGKKVTVMRRGSGMATNVAPHIRELLLSRLKAKGVTLLTDVRYDEITPHAVVISKGGRKETIEADSIVLAAGSRPEASLYEELKGKVPQLHLVGDAVSPRKIETAMEEGYRAALSIS